MPERSELFRSDDLLVRACDQGGEVCVVTFDNHGSSPDLEAPGFGEQFLADRGLDAVVVRGRGNRWYRYAEMPAALAAIAAHVRRYRRVVTYGSSMGGYAAWRFADAIGADAAVALSPQFSLAPASVPFEHRWSQEAAAIDWSGEAGDTVGGPALAIVVHDSRGPDRLHAALIAAAQPTAAIAIPFGGHPVSTFLAGSGLLEELLREALDGSLDAAAFRREALARRRGAPFRLLELSRRLPARRQALALAIARRGHAAQPESVLAMNLLARQLSIAGEHGEALALHARVTAADPGFAGYRLARSEALEAAGRLGEALALAEELARDQPGDASIHSWLGQLRWAAGDQAGALASAERAVALSPGEAHYAGTLALYHHRRSPAMRVRRWLARVTRRWRKRSAPVADG